MCTERGASEDAKRTKANHVMVARTAMHDVSRPGVVLDPPDEPLRAPLDLTDALLARHGASRELVSTFRGRVQHDSDLAQPTRQLALDTTDERLRAGAGAPESFAHAAQGEAELPCAACLGVWCGCYALGERCTAWEIRRERDGEGGLEDGQGGLEVAFGRRRDVWVVREASCTCTWSSRCQGGETQTQIASRDVPFSRLRTQRFPSLSFRRKTFFA